MFLEGVDQEKVDTEFNRMSVDVKFHDVNGKNYRCAIPKLNKEIVPEKCKVLVKPTKVIITLVKASKGNWMDLHFKDDKVISLLGSVWYLVVINAKKCNVMMFFVLKFRLSRVWTRSEIPWLELWT